MKKIFVVFIPLFLTIFLCVFSQFSLKSLIGFSAEGEVRALNLGFVIEEYLTENYKVYKDNEKVVGECVTINGGQECLNKIASRLGFMLTNKYEIGESCVYEGVSPKLKYSINNKQANVQIAVLKEKITIASPIIYGSY